LSSFNLFKVFHFRDIPLPHSKRNKMALSALAPPTENVTLKIDSVQIYINAELLGKASLHVAHSRLSWVMESGPSFSLEYPSINMHSVCRDTKTFPHECLFLMVEGDVGSKAAAIMKGESPTPPKKSKVDDEEDDDQVAITEIRFVLPDSSKLQDLFDNMSDCQALHEDQAQVAMEEEEEAEYEEEYADYEEEEEGEEEQNGYELEGNVAVLDEETAVDYSAMCPGEEDMTPQGLATLKRLEAFLCNGDEQNQNGTNQFDDAEAEPMTT